MSLIYDYLKINGKGVAGKRSKIEIPPALLKGDSPNRFNRPTLLILLGACLIGGILIALIYNMYSARQGFQVLADQEIPPQNVEKVSGSMPTIAPVDPLAAARLAVRHSSSLPPSVNFSLQPPAGLARGAALVFPERTEPMPSTDQRIFESLDTRSNVPASSENPQSSGVVTIKLPAKPSEVEVAMPVVSSRQLDGKPSVKQSSVKRYEPVETHGTGPDKIEKYYQAGLQAQHGGDLRVAEIYYQKTLALSHQHINSLINLSVIYIQQERYKEAEILLLEILGEDPANSKALVNLGVVNLYQGRNIQAEEYFLKALQTNPFEENGLINLAFLAEQKKDYAAAEMYYKKVLQISPQNVEVMLAYAYQLEQQDRYPEAVAVYQDSLGLDAVRKDKKLFASIMERRGQIAKVLNESRQ